MLVQCPSCKTKYKVSDDVVKDTTPAFRCSRCKHTFELELELPRYAQRVEPDAPRLRDAPQFPAPAPKQEPELNFSFSPESAKPESNRDEIANKPSQPADEKSAFVESSAVPAASNTEDRWLIDAAEPKTEEPFVMTQPDAAPVEEQFPPNTETSNEAPPASAAKIEIPVQLATHVHPDASVSEQRASTVPFLSLFGVLIAVFAFATGYYAVHPEHSEGIVQQIPLIGPSVLKNEHLKKNVELKSVQTSYQTIQGNREVFVVTGVALNKNPVVIRDVRIAGELYSPEGKAIEQQTVWIGNAISLKIVRGMTAQDISDLQRLKPLKSFEIAPGDSVPFTIVFLKAPREAKNFSCQIVSADAEA